MSRCSADKTAVEVAIEDEYGVRTGKTALVHIDFVVEVDNSYGADADGNRGVRKVEYSVIDKYIDPHDLKHLTEEEVRQALDDAEQEFHTAQKHF